jgi:3-hydroxybutyryl-CoA dehydrogenase
VAVVGSGTMGAGIAQVFAQSGFGVLLHDSSAQALTRATEMIRSSAARLIARGTLAVSSPDEILSRITVCHALDECANADLVVESIVEDPGAKQALFSTLDGICAPAVVFASNTSSVSISRLAATTGRPGQLFGMHFMNPVPLMPLVELVRGEHTTELVMRQARELCEALGKTAVEAADSPGFISNRVLMPMINEAAFVLMEEVASAEAIDQVMTLGMKHPMGPLALADFIGLDVCVAILDVMYEGLGDAKYRACPLLRRLVVEGQLGRKSGRGFYSYD